MISEFERIATLSDAKVANEKSVHTGGDDADTSAIQLVERDPMNRNALKNRSNAGYSGVRRGLARRVE